jgi:putative cell wall-binding protein
MMKDTTTPSRAVHPLAKLVRLLLCILLAAMSLAALPAAAYASDEFAVSQDAGERGALAGTLEISTLAGAADISWFTGNPSASTFTINTSEQLLGLAALVNGTAGYAGGLVDFAGKTVYLKAATVFNLGGMEWVPIGTRTAPFNGIFNGQRSTQSAIQGFKITQTYQHSGLFGYTGAAAQLKNVQITSATGLSATVLLLSPTTQLVRNVGLLVGTSQGSVDNCAITGEVRVQTATTATLSDPYVVQNVGGVAGFCKGDLSNTMFGGVFEIKIATNAKDPRDEPDAVEGAMGYYKVGDSLGGVVGRFGEPGAGNHGTITNCVNNATIWVATTGTAAKDRFGVDTYPRTYYIGGVVGFSNGSVVSSTNGSYDAATHTGTGLVSTSAVDVATGTFVANRGADSVGGVVGAMATTRDTQYTQTTRGAEDPLAVVNCRNFGRVIGMSTSGGIIGAGAAFTTITQCSNGWPNGGTQDEESCGEVTTTRWNKPTSGGIAGRIAGGVVSYCANYAKIYNVAAGYYTSGIAGALEDPTAPAVQQSELYACYNVGHVWTQGSTAGQDYREAGLVGINDGFVHDSVTMEGSVPYHGDSAIGESIPGLTDNLATSSSAVMKTSTTAALLNTVAWQAQSCPFPAALGAYATGEWRVYWYVDGTGSTYPRLYNYWTATGIAAGATPLGSLSPAPTATVRDHAQYVAATVTPSPVLEVVAGGTTLVQGADFRVQPQTGATEIGGPYQAGIVGIGRYSGTVTNVAQYTIGKGDLSRAAVATTAGLYDFGRLVAPLTVDALVQGQPVSSSEFSYRIYSQNTTSAKNSNDPTYDYKTQGFVVFDSAGYWSDDNGVTKHPLSGALAEPLPPSTTSFTLYDRGVPPQAPRPISDNLGRVYRSNGTVNSQDQGCINFFRVYGREPGLLIELLANSDSTHFDGETLGRYVINQIDLYTNCDITSITWEGQTWQHTVSVANLTNLITGGPATATFTGETIEPDATVEYSGHALSKGDEFELYYSDPNPVDSSYEPNRDATVDAAGNPLANVKGRATVTVQASSTAVNANFKNYVNMYFEIAPARLGDCVITLPQSSYLYTGMAQTPKPKVELNGVTLREGVDYTLSYSNNAAVGTAHVGVVALDNLKGDTTTTRTIDFAITAPGSKTTQQFEGATRYETAAAIIAAAYPSGSDGAIVCYGGNYPDSLAASSLAGLLDYPIVTTETTSLPPVVRATLVSLARDKAAGTFEVIVVGGEAAIGASVVGELQAISSNVRRVFGDNRYATQLALYNEGKENPRAIANGGWGDTVIVATGGTYADALSIAPFACRMKAPIFLASPTGGLMAAAQAALLSDYGNNRTTTHAIIVGGESAVTGSVATTLNSLVKPSDGVNRRWGANRYETSKEIASYLVSAFPGEFSYHNVAFTTGQNFADALVGGVLQSKDASIVILADEGAAGTSGVDHIAANSPAVFNIRYFGGTSAVSAALRTLIEGKLGIG